MNSKMLTLDKLPPHSIEAEQGVLGCILTSPKDCLGEALEKLKVKEAFYDLRHQIIFESMDERSDLITLMQSLKDQNVLDQVGGVEYLASLQDKVPSTHNLPNYIDIVHEKYLMRKLVATCSQMAEKVSTHEGRVDELMDEVEQGILEINRDRNTSATKSLAATVDKAIETIENYKKTKGNKDSLSTGFHFLDKVLISGLCGSKMVVIAARPSEGKTTLGMNMMEHMAIDCNKPVGIFSLEMDSDELMMRTICCRSSIGFEQISSGDLSEDNIYEISKVSGKIRRSPMHIDDTGGLTIMQIKSRARRMVQRYGVKIIMIDYLQLVSGSKKRGESNRQQEISDISNSIKSLAKELKIPILILAQLNREIEKEKGRRPRLSDLRESGAIEQDADIVLMPFNPNPTEEGQNEPDEVPMRIFVAKQRGGPRNRLVDVVFHKKFTRFEAAKL